MSTGEWVDVLEIGHGSWVSRMPNPPPRPKPRAARVVKPQLPTVFVGADGRPIARTLADVWTEDSL